MKTIQWFVCAAVVGVFTVFTGCKTPTERLQDRFRGTRFVITACSEIIACEGRNPQDLGCNKVGWTLEFKADVNDAGTANAGEFGNATGSANFGWRSRVKKYADGTRESYLDLTGFPMGNGEWKVDHFRRWPGRDKEELEIISSWLDSNGCRHTVRLVAELQE